MRFFRLAIASQLPVAVEEPVVGLVEPVEVQVELQVLPEVVARVLPEQAELHAVLLVVGQMFVTQEGDSAAKIHTYWAIAPLLAVNKNLIPFDPHPPEAPSGLRLSSNAGTARGFGVAEFERIAGFIGRVLAAPNDETEITAIRNDVRTLCAAWPIY